MAIVFTHGGLSVENGGSFTQTHRAAHLALIVLLNYG